MSTLCKQSIDATPTTCGVKRFKCHMYPLNKCIASRIPSAAFLAGVRTLYPDPCKFDRLFETAEMADRIFHTTLLHMDITSEEDKCVTNLELYMSMASFMAVKFDKDEVILVRDVIQSLGLCNKTNCKELLQVEANILQATNWMKGITPAVSD